MIISINLLPEELRPKQSAVFSLPKPGLIIISVLGLIIGLHIFFSILIFINSLQYRNLTKKWAANKYQLKKIEEWKKEKQRLSQDYQDISKIISQRVLVQKLLKVLRDNVAEGMWFRILKIKAKDIYLEGSVVSLEGEHMSIFRLFCDNLKKDNEFFNNISNFQVGPIKMRKVFNLDILDFIIELKIK